MNSNIIIMCYLITFPFLLAATFVTADERCPVIHPVKNFNFKSMGSGVWYDLARYFEESIEKGSVGNRYIFYNQTESSVQFTVDELRDGKLNSFNGTLQMARNAGDTGQLIYSVDEEGGILINLDVVEIEYDKYLILYYCLYEDKTQKRTDFAWISARKIGGDIVIVDKIKKFFKLSGLINPKKLIWEKDSDHELVSKMLKNKS